MVNHSICSIVQDKPHKVKTDDYAMCLKNDLASEIWWGCGRGRRPPSLPNRLYLESYWDTDGSGGGMQINQTLLYADTQCAVYQRLWLGLVYLSINDATRKSLTGRLLACFNYREWVGSINEKKVYCGISEWFSWQRCSFCPGCASYVILVSHESRIKNQKA